MLHLLLALAHADDLAVADLTLELEMPAVRVDASPGGRSPWQSLPDGMAAELALTRYGIPLGDASVLTVEHPENRTRLDWTELATGDIRMRVEKPGHREVCTTNLRGTLWAGSVGVAVYEPTRGRDDALRTAPGLLLVEDHPTIGALVSLTPGDSVTVSNVRRDGVILREWMELDRAGEQLRVERSPDSERICYSPARASLE